MNNYDFEDSTKESQMGLKMQEFDLRYY